MYLLNKNIEFPSVNLANEDGILAIGGDLSIERLQEAYKNGIFPWYNEDEPIIWYSPNPRMVLFPSEVKISKSMQQLLKKEVFTVTVNKNFEEVIANCKTVSRKDQEGTWITKAMQEAYIKLHKKGLATSIEVWKNKKLVGGLYGVSLGAVFSGESMFSKVSNASKVAFIYLAQNLKYTLIDCQIYNDHLASLGAREITREDFLKML